MDVMMKKNISTGNLLAAINGGVRVSSIKKVCYNNNVSTFRFLESPKSRNLKFTCANLRSHLLLRSISSTTQAHEGAVVSEIKSENQSKTVHVKFVLQKQCLFGEQFFLVGDDPMLGLWDPLKAIPMSWSNYHIWTTELDIPVDSSIQFKIILRGLSGEFHWQSGPDRIIRIWDTSKTVVVCEDWENAEFQKSEEEPLISSSNESNVTADAQQKAADGKSLESLINKKTPLKNEGSGMLVAGIAPNAVPKSASDVVNGRTSNALNASDVAKDCNSSQLYSKQEDIGACLQKAESSNNNFFAKETIIFSEKSSTASDYDARENFCGTLKEDKSHQNEFNSQSTVDILGNDISWGLKALNQLLLILGFSMNASEE